MFSTVNEEDRINLQALQNRDPYIIQILDQAQRVCVYKFLADKREWERKDLEGTLFVYERSCEPYHGFVILSTVSRETFVQIIKSSMEFKHSPNYEAFLQYKVDIGDIYGLWFISKNDCPRVSECLENLTIKAKEFEQKKSISLNGHSNIFSLLTHAQEQFEELKYKSNENSNSVPITVTSLFSVQDNPSQTNSNNEREQELKKALGIINKPTLEKQVHHSSTSTNHLLMTPAKFQSFQLPQSPVLIASDSDHSRKSLSKNALRLLLIDMLQNDEEFLTILHNAYTEKHNSLSII